VKILYRRWDGDDAGGIRALLRETWIDAYGAFIPREDILSYLDAHYDIESIRGFIGDPNIAGFVAEADATICGCVKTFFHAGEKRLYVQQLYILPEFQSRGIGSQLMAFAAERAKTLDLDRVWLGVMIRNTSAVLWYEKMGYRIVENAPFTMGKTEVDHYIGYVPVEDILSRIRFGGPGLEPQR